MLTSPRKDSLEFSPSKIQMSWHNRRLQRTVLFAVVLLLTITMLSNHMYTSPFESISEVHRDTLQGLHNYGSVPEEGRPKLPFKNDNERKATEEPFFSTPDEEYETSITQLPGGIRLDPTRLALIIETRPLPHLPALMVHFMTVLPLQWTFRFMGSAESIQFMETSRSIQQYVEIGKLQLTEVPPHYDVLTQEGISTMLTDLDFYKTVLAPAEWLLIFQPDTIVCASSSISLDDWVARGYSWIGAPWHVGNDYGGNGGLSLRHLKPIIALLEGRYREVGDEWEDRWLCDHLAAREDTLMPPPDIERQFSVESIWADRPFGYHLRGSGDRFSLDWSLWANERLKNHMLTYCPEIKIALSQLVFDITSGLDKGRVAEKLLETDLDYMADGSDRMQQPKGGAKKRPVKGEAGYIPPPGAEDIEAKGVAGAGLGESGSSDQGSSKSDTTDRAQDNSGSEGQRSDVSNKKPGTGDSKTPEADERTPSNPQLNSAEPEDTFPNSGSKGSKGSKGPVNPGPGDSTPDRPSDPSSDRPVSDAGPGSSDTLASSSTNKPKESGAEDPQNFLPGFDDARSPEERINILDAAVKKVLHPNVEGGI